MKKKAIIVSIKGPKLTKKEKILLSKENPWGIILFKRNIESFNQLKKFIKFIKKLTKNKRFPILVDEEGSTVSRLTNIYKNNLTHIILAIYMEKILNQHLFCIKII